MKRIILSPHIDDAILSLGGAILNWLEDGEDVRVINVFSTSVSSRLFRQKGQTVEVETAVRKKEELEVATILGDIFENWDYLSAGCRYGGNFRQLLPATIQRTLPGERATFQSLLERLRPLFLGCQIKIYAPLSPRSVAHIDHAMLRDAALCASNQKLSSAQLWLYEDMPYCARATNDIGALKQSKIQPKLYSISFSAKANLARLYHSQVTDLWLDEMRIYHDNIGAERVWDAKGIELSPVLKRHYRRLFTD